MQNHYVRLDLIPNLSNLAKNSPYPEEFQSSRQFLEDSRIDGILEFRIENHVLGQKLSWKSTLYVKIGKKIGHFQAIIRVPENFWKFPGMMKFWNSVLKIKFLDINWVGFISYMLKSVKTSQFQGTSGILESWIPGSRNHNISSNVCKMNTNMLCKLAF